MDHPDLGPILPDADHISATKPSSRLGTTILQPDLGAWRSSGGAGVPSGKHRIAMEKKIHHL